jgi:hypothetical protein
MTEHPDIIDVRLPKKPVTKPTGPITFTPPPRDPPPMMGLALILAFALATLLVVASVLR